MYKFNGGTGAIICDECRIIIKAPVDLKLNDKSYFTADYNGPHVCKKCLHKKKFKKKLEEIINE